MSSVRRAVMRLSLAYCGSDRDFSTRHARCGRRRYRFRLQGGRPPYDTCGRGRRSGRDPAIPGTLRRVGSRRAALRMVGERHLGPFHRPLHRDPSTRRRQQPAPSRRRRRADVRGRDGPFARSLLAREWTCAGRARGDVKRTEASVGDTVSVRPLRGCHAAHASEGGREAHLLVGDSITAGYGDEGAIPTRPFSPDRERVLDLARRASSAPST